MLQLIAQLLNRGGSRWAHLTSPKSKDVRDVYINLPRVADNVNRIKFRRDELHFNVYFLFYVFLLQIINKNAHICGKKNKK